MNITVIKKNKIIKSVEDTLLNSKRLDLWEGHIIKSRKNLITFSKTNLSLNKFNENITVRRIHLSTTFFCKKSNNKPSCQTKSATL